MKMMLLATVLPALQFATGDMIVVPSQTCLDRTASPELFTRAALTQCPDGTKFVEHSLPGLRKPHLGWRSICITK